MNAGRNKESMLLRRVVIGVVLIAAGTLLMLERLDLISPDIARWLFTWQMLLITIGFVNLFSRENFALGIILVLTGAFFLVPKIMLNLTFNFVGMFWPLLLVGAGLLLLLKQGSAQSIIHRWFRKEGDLSSAPNQNQSTREEGYFDSLNIFSGTKQNVSSTFRGGSFVNIFGGGEVNLVNAKLEGDYVIVECIILFGGCTFYVPSDWEVKLEVTSILGGFTDKRSYVNSSLVEPRKTLIIKGVCAFGGGEIKY